MNNLVEVKTINLSVIKNNWKIKNRKSHDLLIYLILTRKNYKRYIKSSFRPSNKTNNAYKHSNLVNITIKAIGTHISLINELISYDKNLCNQKIKEVHNILLNMLLEHLKDINTLPAYKQSRYNFIKVWKHRAKQKSLLNTDFLFFVLCTKQDFKLSMLKAFPQVKEKNRNNQKYRDVTPPNLDLQGFNGLFETFQVFKYKYRSRYNRFSMNHNLKYFIILCILTESKNNPDFWWSK